MVQLLRVLVEDLDSSYVVALSLRFGPRRLRLFNRSPTLFQSRWARRFPEWMVVRHSHAPISHAAGRIFFRHAGKRLASLLVPEGMEHGDGAVELRPNCCVAGNGKIYLAEFFRLP